MEEKKTFRDRVDELKTEAKNKWYRTCDWCRDNREVLIMTIPIAVGGAFELLAKEKSTKDEKYLKERYIYDRSNGHYYETRRKVKNREWVEIDARHAISGEPIGDILQDMRLLK